MRNKLINCKMDEVLRQDLILEIIIGHATRNSDGSHSPTNICRLRLVQKRWLKAVTKILHKRRQPIFKLELNSENSVNGSDYVRRNGKLLDWFVNSVTSSARMDFGHDSLFSLKIMADFFRLENHESFSKLLSECGTRLTELEMFVPLNGGSFPCIHPPKLSFPLLKNLTVHLSSNVLPNLAEDEKNNPNDVCVTYLIHSILNATENLTEFAIPSTKWIARFPQNFQFVTLPDTITNLNLACSPRAQDLDFLGKSKLPGLTQLQFMLSHIPLTDGSLYKIMDNFKSTLKTVFIQGNNIKPNGCLTLLRFPEMKLLESIAITTGNYDLEPDQQQLERKFPKLRSLIICLHTASMFRKWTLNSKYESVHTLLLGLICDGQIHRSPREYSTLSIDAEIMQQIHMAFPNIQKAHFILSTAQTCGLKYMFLEMRQLKSLTIRVAGNDEMKHSDFWDALLIGATEGLVAGLRSSPDYWEFVKFENDRLPSIKMLTELKSLTLEARCALDPSIAHEQSLISDIAFQFALLKMPTLMELCFKGKFLASPKMVDSWQRSGKKFSYALS